MTSVSFGKVLSAFWLPLFVALLSLGRANAAAEATSEPYAADHPCKAIVSACEAAGYLANPRAPNSKGLRIECMRNILAGTPVEGVSISAHDVAACKAKKTKHKDRKAP